MKKALSLHAKFPGKIGTQILTPVKNRTGLSLVYTPGVAEVSQAIAKNRKLVNKYTLKGRTVAIVSDGSAVLGLGNVGPAAALPVMEGKALLFKAFANLDAYPICLDTQEPAEIIQIVKALTPSFGAVNLEDIAAPKCFAIEEALQDIGIPVMHDDQHGTAVVVLAALINSAKVVGKKMGNLKVVVNGAGAAGNAIANLVRNQVSEVIVLDSTGIIYQGRPGLDPYKEKLAQVTNREFRTGDLKIALQGADVFIGVSRGNLLKRADVKLMNERAIVLAMANPNPEILPEEALKGGAAVVATGRSDFPNQVNNALAFPGIFKGVLQSGKVKITTEMKMAAAHAIAKLVEKPTPGSIIPSIFDKKVVPAVAKAVAR
ncbi:MAG: NADP-dependent malic enzyme [Candidatus Daviesbacteria bacterium]|nr:MAG: NADP-dependent malic enzyme [Candidatus Daviesbacteria bacterium]